MQNLDEGWSQAEFRMILLSPNSVWWLLAQWDSETITWVSKLTWLPFCLGETISTCSCSSHLSLGLACFLQPWLISVVPGVYPQGPVNLQGITIDGWQPLVSLPELLSCFSLLSLHTILLTSQQNPMNTMGHYVSLFNSAPLWPWGVDQVQFWSLPPSLPIYIGNEQYQSNYRLAHYVMKLGNWQSCSWQ